MILFVLVFGIGVWFGGVFIDKKGLVKMVVFLGIIFCVGFVLFLFWVMEKWEFVVVSVVVGIGFGFLLGVLLNVFVLEVVKMNKGIVFGMFLLVR